MYRYHIFPLYYNDIGPKMFLLVQLFYHQVGDLQSQNLSPVCTVFKTLQNVLVLYAKFPECYILKLFFFRTVLDGEEYPLFPILLINILPCETCFPIIELKYYSYYRV